MESYHKIVDNSEKKQKLDEAITNSYIEIRKIKDCILKMNETNNVPIDMTPNFYDFNRNFYNNASGNKNFDNMTSSNRNLNGNEIL